MNSSVSGSFDKLSDVKQITVKEINEEKADNKTRGEVSSVFFGSVILACGIIMMVTAVQTNNFLALVPGSLAVSVGSIYFVSAVYDWLFGKS